MFTKQIINTTTNNKPPKPSNLPTTPLKQSSHTFFTAQALKSTANFFTQKKSLPDSKVSSQTGSPKTAVFKGETIGNPIYFSQNLAALVGDHDFNTSSELIKMKSLPNNRNSNEKTTSSLNSMTETSPKMGELSVRNQDTGEVFDLNDHSQANKLQEPFNREYLEKLKKRKKEEIWQDWWQDKKKYNLDLLIAVKGNNLLQVKKLFEESNFDKKPDINYKDEKGWASLHFACLAGNFEMVLVLIKQECDKDPQTNLKQTPLIISAQKCNFF